MDVNQNHLSCAIAFNYHDSSVSFSTGNKVVLVLEAERIFRKKKMSCTKEEMEILINYGLSSLNRTKLDVAFWAMSTLNNPWLHGYEVPYLPEYRTIDFYGLRKKVLLVNHHYCHASAFYFSEYKKATIISCDGGGDNDECCAVFEGENLDLSKLNLLVDEMITARPYDSVSQYLYKSPHCEGKLMALAAYGKVRTDIVSIFEDIVPLLNYILDNDGQKLLKSKFPNYVGIANINNKYACDIAASFQYYFVKKRLSDITKIIDCTDTPAVILVGGSSLNLEVNTAVWDVYQKDKEIYIPSCCDDTGQSLGAICYLIKEMYNIRPIVNLPFLGDGYEEIILEEKTLDLLVDDLIEGKVLLVHNSQSEIGPRALGNRSLIARADSTKLKNILSVEIKERESYRPIAPIVTEEKVNDYFFGPKLSPFMLYQYKVKELVRNQVIGGIHKNNTARVQTISKNSNPFLHLLLYKYGEKTGTHVLLNTSLNLKGEPLSNNIQDTINLAKTINYPHRIVYNGKIMNY